MLEEKIPTQDEVSLISEDFYTLEISPRQIDLLLANGWRHFGTHFFRYNFGIYSSELRRVFPLRVRLADFSPSKSQRRIIRKNRDLQTIVRPIRIDEEKEILFDRHKQRFNSGNHFPIHYFVPPESAQIPTKGLEMCVYKENKLLAASFFDVGRTSLSSIYAIFDTDESKRSLGIYTMLLEIKFAVEREKAFYYQGYAYEGESFYDYKKRFLALEKYDWNGSWTDFEEAANLQNK